MRHRSDELPASFHATVGAGRRSVGGHAALQRECCIEAKAAAHGDLASDVAVAAERPEVARVVGPAVDHGHDVVDLVAGAAAELAGIGVAVEDLGADAPPLAR